MTAALTLAGWFAAAFAAAVAVSVRRSASSRAEAVTRACHELRGPLGCVRLALELGLRVGGLTTARIRALELELRQATLALDDLDVADPRRTGLRTVESVDVGQLAAESVEALRARAEAHGAKLNVRWGAAQARVWGDRLRLAQALGNLIANAVEHGGGLVEVIGRQEAGHVRIEVTDRGRGLPAPVAELARNARRGRGQRGRGLAITSAIAEAHGGRLAAAPSSRGARLVLTLPAVDGP